MSALWVIGAVLFALWRLECDSALESVQYAVIDCELWQG